MSCFLDSRCSFCTVAWLWQGFNWHDASRGHSAIAELLVHITIAHYSVLTSTGIENCTARQHGCRPTFFSLTLLANFFLAPSESWLVSLWYLTKLTFCLARPLFGCFRRLWLTVTWNLTVILDYFCTNSAPFATWNKHTADDVKF